MRIVRLETNAGRFHVRQNGEIPRSCECGRKIPSRLRLLFQETVELDSGQRRVFTPVYGGVLAKARFSACDAALSFSLDTGLKVRRQQNKS